MIQHYDNWQCSNSVLPVTSSDNYNGQLWNQIDISKKEEILHNLVWTEYISCYIYQYNILGMPSKTVICEKEAVIRTNSIIPIVNCCLSSLEVVKG